MSLSDERIISLLNRSFIPVFTSNEDYRGDGAASKEERALLAGIHREGLKKGLSVGTVHAYVVGPGGEVLDSLHTVEAAKSDRLLKMLNGAASRFPEAPQTAKIPAANPSARPGVPGGLTLQLTARYLERRAGSLELVENAGGNWSALPGEDRILLMPDEVRRFVVVNGGIPTFERSLLERVMLRFYPPTENNDTSKNRIDHLEYTASIERGKGSASRIRFSGRMRMKHPFYHKDDDWAVSLNFAGYCDMGRGNGRINRFRMATEGAEYSNGKGSNLPFGVAVSESNGI